MLNAQQDLWRATVRTRQVSNPKRSPRVRDCIMPQFLYAGYLESSSLIPCAATAMISSTRSGRKTSVQLPHVAETALSETRSTSQHTAAMDPGQSSWSKPGAGTICSQNRTPQSSTVTCTTRTRRIVRLSPYTQRWSRKPQEYGSVVLHHSIPRVAPRLPQEPESTCRPASMVDQVTHRTRRHTQ